LLDKDNFLPFTKFYNKLIDFLFLFWPQCWPFWKSELKAN
jgi:hypothetical protein